MHAALQSEGSGNLNTSDSSPQKPVPAGGKRKQRTQAQGSDSCSIYKSISLHNPKTANCSGAARNTAEFRGFAYLWELRRLVAPAAKPRSRDAAQTYPERSRLKWSRLDRPQDRPVFVWTRSGMAQRFSFQLPGSTCVHGNATNNHSR